MSIQRNAQSFYLTSNLQTAVVAANIPFTLTSTSALNLLMDSLYFQCGGFVNADRGTILVTALSLSGQSLMASNAGMPFSAFLPNNNYAIEGINSLSLTIATSQVFSATISGGMANPFTVTNPVGFAISTEPTDIVVSPNDSGGLLSYAFGMGSVAVPAGGQATLQATCLRDDVFLGRLVMDTDSNRAAININNEALQVISILVNGIELLSSVTPANAPLLLSQLTPTSNDKTGLQANYRVALNSIVSIVVQNSDVVNIHNVSGGFYCKPL
tara:strand:- start:1784 stop:2596 length:813 start_codon:yes stop_codon:yes gene_type:complete